MFQDSNDIMVKRVPFDYLLVIATALLIMAGIVTVYSASAVLAQERFHDSYYFLKKEIFFVVAGFILMAVMAKVPYKWLKKIVYPMVILSLIVLAMAFIPGLKKVASGASRWVRLGPITFQPSELAKLSIIIFLAYSLEKKASRIKTFTIGFLPQAAVVGVLMVVTLAQKDFGAAFVMAVITGFMMFVAGVRITYLAASVLSALPAAYFLIASVGYRRKRILAFLDPWQDRYGSGFQIIQSLVSFNEGGLLGRGLGEGRQKLFYLPEAHTDFILSVVGEEMGFVGIMVIIALFVFFLWRAATISMRAPDLFGRYLAFGITIYLAFQTIFNFCVVMGLLPTKGLVLPFLSYGGSALMTMMIAVGILLNISSYKAVSNEG